MDEDFLTRLAAAKTDDDRSWLVTEMRLDKLDPDLKSMVLAAAIPHWFDENMLAALRPELTDRKQVLYEALIDLSFVEPFGSLGYHLHDSTRHLILNRHYLIDKVEFRYLSKKIVEYFDARPEVDSEIKDDTNSEVNSQIEQVYHRIASDPATGSEALTDLVLYWQEPIYQSKLESLLKSSKEQLTNLDCYDFLDDIYSYTNDQLSVLVFCRTVDNGAYFLEQSQILNVAQLLGTVGDGFQFLKQPQEALKHYEISVKIYHAIGEHLEEA